MPYSNIRKVVDVSVVDWEVEGIFHVDCYHPAFIYYVLVEDDCGERWVHEVVFSDHPELVEVESGDCYLARAGHEGRDRAEYLAKRVYERGVINLSHWGFHEFFSLTLEQRFAEEAMHEDMHRKGYGHLSNGAFSGGHC